jgi:4-hydroxy-tetrahydrodipicolinate reductase
MGRILTLVAAGRKDVIVTSAVDRLQAAGPGATGVAVGTDLDAAVTAADVVVDFSQPEAFLAVVRAALGAGRPLVSGTTGLGPEALLAIEGAAERIPVLHAPNLSPGVALITALVSMAAAALPDFDIEVVELHHRHKLDAPSGTALQLGRAAAGARGLDPDAVLVHGRSGATGPRPAAEIGVHALRGGSVFGDHAVHLLGEHERIEIVHRAGSRELFALGAIAAARFLHGRPPGRYSLRDVLGI